MECPESSVLDVLQEFDNELTTIRETAQLSLLRLQQDGGDINPSADACQVIIDQTRLIEWQLGRPLNALQNATSSARPSIPRVILDDTTPPISANEMKCRTAWARRPVRAAGTQLMVRTVKRAESALVMGRFSGGGG